MSFDIYFLNFQYSIRAYVRYRAFVTLQIELYCVVDYDRKWSTKYHKDCKFGNFFNSTFKMSFDIYFLNFQYSIRAYVRYITFVTLQIELYCLVDYDSKWSTKYHKDCKFEIL